MRVQLAATPLVGADDAVDGLMRDGYAISGERAGYLLRRPVPLDKQLNGPLLGFLANGMVAGLLPLTVHGVGVRRLVVVATPDAAVPLDLARDGAWGDADRLRDVLSLEFQFEQQANYVPLLQGQLFVHRQREFN